MVHNLEAALKERINTLDWMSPATKQKAQDKLSKIMVKIGYPDKWKDYKGLTIDRGAYVLNVERADSWEVARIMNKLGKPVDRTEWTMTPPTVNAYYNPSMNEIVFPAGILQPPFFNPAADDAINYGGIGAVIGHELTHGFDDEGRQFDANGNLTDWWTKADADNFNAKAQNIVKQFNSYVPIGDMHINGQLTLGENIADLGGLTIAYAAFKKAQADSKADTAAKIDGFTPDQRFFLGWAQVWRSEQTDQALQQQIRTNPHSPAKFRVNGPVSNMDAFYKAFNLKKGDPMMAADSLRSKIW
jgi:putative endopeptidase